MPSSEARRLTELHRLAQARIGATTVRQMLTVWPLLQADNLDSTYERWLQAVRAIVAAQRPVSSQLAAQYVQVFRTLEVGSSVPVVFADPAEDGALATSMLVTGPVSIKANMARGMSLADADDIGAANSSRSGMRYVMDGGRATVAAMLAGDRRSQGYRRVTSGSPCAYCSDLEGTEFATDEVFPAHDGCNCQAEPIYS